MRILAQFMVQDTPCFTRNGYTNTVQQQPRPISGDEHVPPDKYRLEHAALVSNMFPLDIHPYATNGWIGNEQLGIGPCLGWQKSSG